MLQEGVVAVLVEEAGEGLLQLDGALDGRDLWVRVIGGGEQVVAGSGSEAVRDVDRGLAFAAGSTNIGPPSPSGVCGEGMSTSIGDPGAGGINGTLGDRTRLTTVLRFLGLLERS